jgi:hypothetical protein
MWYPMDGKGKTGTFQGISRGLILLLVLINAAGIAGVVLELTDGSTFLMISGDSMEHGKRKIDIIDDGDGVIASEVDSRNDLVTYFQGRQEDYRKFGDYGDVISFNVNGGGTKFTHRIILFIVFNNTLGDATADIPELNVWNVTTFLMQDVGYRKDDLLVNFTMIYTRMVENDFVVREGYITKGDNRNYVDQMSLKMFVAPVRMEDVIGKVDVADNELIQSGKLSYVSIFAIIPLFLLFFGIWAILNRSGRTVRNYRLLVRCTLMVSLTTPLILSFNLLAHSGLGLGPSILAILTYVIFALVLTGLGIITWTLMRRRDPEDRVFLPASFLILFLGFFFIAKADMFHIYQSIPLVLVVNSMFYLDPRKFFPESRPSNVVDRISWTIICCANLILFVFMINYTLPPYVFLGVGWAAGNIYCILKLDQSRARYKSFK